MGTYLDPGSAVDADVRKTCLEIVRQFPAIPNVWGYSSSSSSDHRNRRCIDYMVIGQPTAAARVRLGDAIVAYHIKNAKRLGVNGVIWNHGVWGFPHEGGQGSYRGPYAKRRKYTGTSNPHTDHVHVEYDGSAYVGPVKPPTPTPVHGTGGGVVATLNIQNPDFRSTQQSAAPWSKRLPAIVALLKKSNASILILNECGKEQAADIQARLGKAWVWDRLGTNVVMRRGDMWSDRRLVQKYLSGPTEGYRRSLVARELVRTGSKQPSMLIAATHLEALSSGFVKTEDEAQALRDKQAREVDALVTQTRTVLCGDFNDADVATGPRAILQAGGLTSILLKTTVKNSNLGTSGAGRFIDDILTSRDLTVRAAEVIDAGSASDHNLLRCQVSFTY